MGSDKKITPVDVFLTVFESKDQKWGNDEGKNRLLGNDLIDKLARLLNTHGMNSQKFYQRQLGLTKGLSEIVSFYSGVSFKQWRNEYIMLGAKELLVETDYKLNDIAVRLGFAGIGSFSHWFIAMEKVTPASWRRVAKSRQAKRDKQILLDAKKSMQRPKL